MVSTDSQRVEALRTTALTTSGRLAGPRRRMAARRLARLRTPAAARALAEVFVADPDGPVGGIAADALRGSSDPACLDAVGEVAIGTGDQRLWALVEATGHLPTRPQRRALWLFLAGRFGDAAELDFDGALLRAAFQNADSDLRRRMAARGRQSGRADWFGALASVNDRERRGRITADEWDFALEHLSGDRRWEDLWRMAHQSPLPVAARILRLLGDHGWQPEAEFDRAGYARLLALADQCRAPLSARSRFMDAEVLAAGLAYTKDFAMHSEAGLLASAQELDDLGVRAWRLPSGEPLGAFEADRVRTNTVAIAPDGSAIAAAGYGEVWLFSVATGKEMRRLRAGEAGRIRALVFTPDGGLVAGADDDGNVWLWNRLTGALSRRLRIGPGAPAMALAAGGRLLAVGTGLRLLENLDHVGGYELRLWHLPSGKAAGTIEVGEYGVRSLESTPDSRYLVGVEVAGTTRVWRLPNLEPVASMGFNGGLASVTMSPDGSLLAGLTVDGSAIEVRHVTTGAIVTAIERTTGDGKAGERLAISADNRLLAGANMLEGPVELWHLPSGASAGRLLDEAKVEYLTFTPHHSLVVGIGGEDGEVLMWRPAAALAGGVPVADVALADADSLRARAAAPEDRPWLDLLGALVEWRHRNDIDLGAGDAIDPPAATDIEATE